MKRQKDWLRQTINQLKERGIRITTARKRVVEIVMEARAPIGAPEILEKLRSQHFSINKTTVYRELGFLEETGVLERVYTKQHATVLYEPVVLGHHHHLICNTCGTMEGVRLPELERRLKTMERSVQTNGFEVNDHSLEFYGTCAGCR